MLSDSHSRSWLVPGCRGGREQWPSTHSKVRVIWVCLLSLPLGTSPIWGKLCAASSAVRWDNNSMYHWRVLGRLNEVRSVKLEFFFNYSKSHPPALPSQAQLHSTDGSRHFTSFPPSRTCLSTSEGSPRFSWFLFHHFYAPSCPSSCFPPGCSWLC